MNKPKTIYEKYNNHIDYYMNTNNSKLYIHNTISNTINIYDSDKFKSCEIEVVNSKNGNTELKSIHSILDRNDFIKTVNIVCNTTQAFGYSSITNKDNGLIENSFNQFYNSNIFIENMNNDKLQDKEIIRYFKKTTPTIYILIKNLFYNENNEVIINFLKWLHIVFFKNKRQDIIYLFMGKNKENQGQGGGKGVLIGLLNSILSNLVVSIDNTTYKNNFNSNLMNKKIIFFDEINFKKLDYNVLKNITGNENIRIEFKGKEPLNVKNVSSLLMFSNEYDLCDKIQSDDRRTFIINPNPTNGSLKKIIKKSFNNFDSFNKKLLSEGNDFIRFISKINDNNIKTPLELITNAKLNYFNNLNSIKINNIQNSTLYLILINKKYKNYMYNLKGFNINKKLIEMNIIDYNTFKDLYIFLSKNKYINDIGVNKSFQIFKDNLINHNYIFKDIRLRETKEYNKLNIKLFISNKINKSKQSKINELLRKLYCIKQITIKNNINITRN